MSQGVGQGDLVGRGPRNLGNANEQALFFTRVLPTRFCGAPPVVIPPGQAQLDPQRVRRGRGPHAILPQRAMEGPEGDGGKRFGN